MAFRPVPAGLLDAAEKRGFPVFEIPYETPYREIIGHVNRSLLSDDFRVVQRSLSTQNYLMALRGEDPVQALVQRLGQLPMSPRPDVPGRGPAPPATPDKEAPAGRTRGGYAMSAPIHHPAQAEIERVREARDTLVELRDDDGLSLATHGSSPEHTTRSAGRST